MYGYLMHMLLFRCVRIATVKFEDRSSKMCTVYKVITGFFKKNKKFWKN
jgi:hypothetical protein